MPTLSLDRQINDYLLTASGHLQSRRSRVNLKHFAAYGSAAGSALAMMGAEAAIVHNGGSPNPPVTASATGGSVVYAGFDMDGDGVNDFSVFATAFGTASSVGLRGGPGMSTVTYSATYTSSSSTFSFTWTSRSYNSVVKEPGDNDVRKLASGATIGASQSFTSAPLTSADVAYYNGLGWVGASANWNASPGEQGFAGVKFKIGANTHYGWVKLQYNGGASLSVLEWAYEDQPDTPIVAGDIGFVAPPPVAAPVDNSALYGLSALAAGALGLGALRRRRSIRVEQEKRAA